MLLLLMGTRDGRPVRPFKGRWSRKTTLIVKV
jgi:hypothetical protein